VNQSRRTCTYDASNSLLSDLREQWEGQWVNNERLTYTYDSSNNRLSEL
jgi:hypothetical protein